MRWVGVSCALPKKNVLSTAAYAHFPKADVDRIIANIGIASHREGDGTLTASDLAIAAGRPLLEKLAWDPKSVDACIFVTQSPDNYLPASSHRIQEQLGIGERSICFDVNLGCSGFTHGLIIVRGLMAAGTVKRAMLFCGDVIAGTFRPPLETCTNPADLGNALLFGDSASACAFEASGEDEVRAISFGADGSGYNNIIVPAGAFRHFWSPEVFVATENEKGELRRPLDLRLQGPDVFAFTMKRVPPLFEEVLQRAEWAPEQVDAVVFHQANKFMLEFLRRKLKLPPAQVPYSIEEFGNTSSASIPITMLTRSAERLGLRTRWVMLGFGVGLSWSAVAMETHHIASVPLVEV